MQVSVKRNQHIDFDGIKKTVANYGNVIKDNFVQMGQGIGTGVNNTIVDPVKSLFNNTKGGTTASGSALTISNSAGSASGTMGLDPVNIALGEDGGSGLIGPQLQASSPDAVKNITIGEVKDSIKKSQEIGKEFIFNTSVIFKIVLFAFAAWGIYKLLK